MEANVRKFIESVEHGHSNVIEVVKSLLPDGTGQMQLVLKHEVQKPVRAESPARNHVFYDAAGFQTYLEENRNKECKLLVLIDCENMLAKAVLDDKAENGFEVIAFEPPHHPVFELIRENLLTQQGVREFASAINRCRKYITGFDGKPVDGPSITLQMRQITVSNQVTAECGEGNGAVNGITLKTNVSTGKTADTKTVLPESMKLKCPVFLTSSDVEIDATITVVPKSAERVEIRTEVPDIDVIIHDEFDAMLTDLHQMQDVQVSFGRIDHAPWAYCK